MVRRGTHGPRRPSRRTASHGRRRVGSRLRFGESKILHDTHQLQGKLSSGSQREVVIANNPTDHGLLVKVYQGGKVIESYPANNYKAAKRISEQLKQSQSKIPRILHGEKRLKVRFESERTRILQDAYELKKRLEKKDALSDKDMKEMLELSKRVDKLTG